MNFEKGQKVWETVCYAKPVVCKCCGLQKYLEIKPRVQQVTITRVVSVPGDYYERVETCMGEDGKGERSFKVVAAEKLFVKKTNAMKAAKQQAAKETMANRLRYLMYAKKTKRVKG